MPQYSTNAIYEHLKAQQGLKNYYLYIQDDNWVLIYGDENANPKLILVVSRLKENLTQEQSSFESDAIKLLTAQPIPVRILRFNESNFVKECAISSGDNSAFETIATTHLYNSLFKPYELTADEHIAAKQVNDATSSTFHDWQRSFLSGKLTVTDVDVIVYNANFGILRIYELKRSYYSLTRWKPFSADYPNFRLLRRSFHKDIPLLILYNLYQGTPRVEDISLLRVFRIIDDKPTIQEIYEEIDGEKAFDFKTDRLFN